MKIVFSLQKVGLGNNGGSRTVIKCAEAIKDLGHDVSICSSSNKYKWHKIRVPVVKHIPPCDALIATGYGSVASTGGFRGARSKFYYVRGFETWIAPEKRLLHSYRTLNCIVNSEWLRDYLTQNRIKSTLVYPGLDFDDFYKTSDNRENIIGGLFSRRHKTKRHDDIIQIGKKLGYKVLLLNRDIVNPSVSDLRDFYNKIKVWISPSELEGLHNPPHEASLCGACLVGTDHPRGGIQDYAKDEHTSLLYPARDLNKACEQTKKLMEDVELHQKLQENMQNFLKEKIGNRQENMKKFIKSLEL